MVGDFSRSEGYRFFDSFRLVNGGSSSGITRFLLTRLLVDDYPPFQYARLVRVSDFQYKVIRNSLGAQVVVLSVPGFGFDPGDYLEFELEYKVQLNPVRFVFDGGVGGEYDVSSAVYRRYTRPSLWVESDAPEVVEVSRRVRGGESDPVVAARLFFDYVVDHISYEFMEERGALFALRNGVGDCNEFSTLFIALCRASGIPARWVQGVAYSNRMREEELGSVEHKWAEFYVEGYGWVPVDPTWAAVRKGRYFGELDNGHVHLYIEGFRELNRKQEQFRAFFEYVGDQPVFEPYYTPRLRRTGEIFNVASSRRLVFRGGR